MAGWQKSRRSNALGSCVEVNLDDAPAGRVKVRDSKDLRPDAPVIVTSLAGWHAFCAVAVTTSSGG